MNRHLYSIIYSPLGTWPSVIQLDHLNDCFYVFQEPLYWLLRWLFQFECIFSTSTSSECIFLFSLHPNQHVWSIFCLFSVCLFASSSYYDSSTNIIQELSPTVHLINRFKNRNHMIIFLDTEKIFDKIQHSFTMKVLENL